MTQGQILNRGGVKSSSPETTTERGGFPDGTGEPAETTAPAETTVTSVTEPPAETTAPAETSVTDDTEETEQDEIDLLELESHVHDGITFEPLIYENNGNLNTGSYYLTEDLSGEFYEGLTINGDVKICLNGHRVDFFVYTEDSTLSIYNDDTEEMGSIEIDTDASEYYYGTKDSNTLNIYGGTINFYDGILRCGTINIYGGKITSSYNLCLYGSKVNISGGYFDSNTDKIYIDSDSELYLSGNPTIERIYVESRSGYDSTPIKIDSPLDPSFNCQISLYDETGLFAVLSDESYATADNFEAAVEGYKVVKVGDKLYLTQHKHDGVEDAFKPCGSDGTANSLPTTSGSYYLSGNVNGDWTAPENATINLCLNGHTINGQIAVNGSTTLNIYDETEGKGTINGSDQYSILDKGTVNIYGGNINNADFGAIRNEYGYLNVKGGTIGKIDNAGQITISGGNVEDLYLQESTAKMRCDITGGNIECISLAAINSYGNPMTKSDEYLYISGNAAIGEISLGRECKINIDDKLENTVPYKIIMDQPGVFTKSASGRATEENFESGMDDYEVAVNDDGELMLQAKPHMHGNTEFKAWDGKGYLDTGSYYVATDNLNEGGIGGNVDLCLNGKTVLSDNLRIFDNAVLNIYDDGEPGEDVQFTFGYNLPYEGNPIINIHGGYVDLNGLNTPATINVLGGKFGQGWMYMGNGILNISGGEICSEIQHDGGTLTLSGNPKMDETIITTSTDNPIQIKGQLGDDVKCKVQLGEDGGAGLFAVLEKEEFASADNFVSAVDGYKVVKAGDKLYLTDHVHDDGTVFLPWTDTEKLPDEPGNWYLTGEVNYDDTCYFNKGVTNLCLNGNIVNSAIEVSEGAELNIDDCKGVGGIKCDSSAGICNSGTLNINAGVKSISYTLDYGYAIVNYESGILTINYSDDSSISSSSSANVIGNMGIMTIKNGTIKGSSPYMPVISNVGKLTLENVAIECTNISNAIGNSDTLTIKGGSIGYESCELETGILNSGTLNLDGDVKFYTTDADICVHSPINITGELKNTYVIETFREPGLIAVMDNESYASADNFKSIYDKYAVVKNGKELYLTDHVHEDGTAFVSWDKKDSLPTEPGNWYLMDNVTLTGTWNVPTGETNLCLNGHDVNGQIVLNTTSTLNIYDCQEASGNITSSAQWGTIFINSSDSTVNIYGENIKNTGTGDDFGSGTAVYNCGSLNIYDGNISGNNYAVVNMGNAKEFTVTGGKMTGGTYGIWTDKNIELSGSPEITGGQADIYLNSGVIIISGELSGTYTIGMETPGVFTSGAQDRATVNNFAPSDDMAARGYEVTETEGGELALTLKKYTITYDHGTDGTGTITPTTHIHNEYTKLSEKTFSRAGYTQVGWTKVVGGETVATAYNFYTDDGQYDLGYNYFDENENVTLYPVWMKNIIKFSPAEVNIKVGSTDLIIAQVLPNSAVYDEIEWSIDGDSGIIELTKGKDYVKIIALKEGTVTLTASINGGETTAECKINVTKTNSEVKPSADETVTYGDELTLSVAVEKDTSGISLMALEDHVEFFNGEKSLGSAEVINGKAELTVKVTKDKFSIGENKIKAVYGGSISLNGSESEEITVDVKKRTLTPSINGTTFEKVYDGNDSANGLGLSITLENVIDGDDVAASGIFTFNSKNVSDAKTITADNITLSGDDAGYYTLSAASLSTEGKIIPAPINVQSYSFTYDGDNVFEIQLNGISDEKLSAKLTVASKNAGTYTYGDSYTIELDSSNYSVDSADPLTINPLIAKIEWQKETSFAYDGEEKEVTAKVTNAVTGDTFTIVYENNKATNVGEYIAEITSLGNDNYKLDNNTSVEWSIKESKLVIDELPTVSAITYGQSLSDSTLTGGVVKNGEITVTGKFEWENGAVKPEVSDSGKTKYTVKFVPDDKNYSDITAKITVTVNKKELVPSVSSVSDKTYDGTTAANGVITLSGAVSGEDPTAAGTFEFTDKNAGESKSVNVSGIKLDDDWNDNYYLSETSLESVKTSAKISPLPAEIKWQDETTFVYDGEEKEVTAMVTNAVTGDTFDIEYENNKEINVGEYTAEITSLGNDNYTLDGAKNVTLEWSISPADREETNVTINYFNETISTSSDMEYSIDGEAWLSCTENMSVTSFGWNGEESLTVKFRYAADNNHNAGAVQTVIIPARPEAPDISGIAVTKTQDSITVTEISGCEYSIDGSTWQNSGTFTEINAGTEYTVQIRTKATENSFASFAAEKEIITSDTSSGTTELKAGETVETENGSITNDGKNVEIEDKNGHKTTVTLPDGVSDSVEVDESGNVQVPDGSIVQTGDKTFELLNGGTVKPDGTITADKVAVGNTEISGDEVTVDKDGNITVSGSGTVQTGDTTFELPDGGKISPDGIITADKIVAGNTEVSGDEVTVDKDGNITVSGSSTVQADDTTVELPDGGTISPDGTITADKVVVGDKTISGDEVTVDKNGNITVSGSGTVQTGDATVELPNGGTVKSDGTITADKVVTNDTTITGDEVTVTPDGNITLPNGGIVNSADRSETIIGKDGSIKNSEVSIEPVNNTDYYDANGEAHSLNNGYIVLDIEPVKDIEIGSDISVIAAYDIRLLYNGKFEVQPNGTVKVTIIAPEGADGTEKVLHLNGNSVEDMNAAYDVNAKTFSFETDHFSVYVIAEKEVSDEPERKPSAPPTIPDRLPATTDKTENTDNNDNGEDVSSGAEIISSDEKISAGIAGNSGLKNILGYLSALAIAAAAAFIAKKNRQK